MEAVEYWKQRCELAEAYIEESPCDPDIYAEQWQAYNAWQEFKKLNTPAVSESVEPVRGGTVCDHPREHRQYVGRNTLRCGICGAEFE